ncbi:N-acetylmuramoyl-L-alanine amidase [Desulfosporosinus sp. SYSU MS00001]|uniref:N-acetylmuramoyl-L-alanine amidase n=1 Tax=Desulfosporosinus sp. SYSU MS00001 TaxID=3416284 RepID=UPI003CF28B82
MKTIRVVAFRPRKVLIIGSILMVCLILAATWKFEGTNQKIWSWTLGHRVVVIDAGHGGVDPGAVGKNKVLEKDITLAIAKRLQAHIQQSGAKTIMVREEDKDLGTSQGLLKRKREDLAQRIQLALEAQANVFISIHANSFPNEKLTGAQTFYNADSAEGKLLAQAIQEKLNLMTKGKRVIKANKDIYILKKAHQAAVTVEVGFLSNPAEEKLLTTPEYQETLAVAIYQGLNEYFSKQKATQN